MPRKESRREAGAFKWFRIIKIDFDDADDDDDELNALIIASFSLLLSTELS